MGHRLSGCIKWENPMHMLKRHGLACCLAGSLLAHLVLIGVTGGLGPLHFTAPVNRFQAVMVDMAKPAADPATAAAPPENATPDEEKEAPVPAKTGETPISPAAPEPRDLQPVVAPPATATSEGNGEQQAIPAVDDAAQGIPPSGCTRREAKTAHADITAHPLRNAGEFLASRHEKLTYRISLLGMPVGNAELEANNEKGEVRISLRVKSDAVLSAIYPVDDLIETRHINGNFIITRIRQQEGMFRGDRGFTIFLRDKSVFWIDLLTNRSVREPIPNSEVMDILSGLYFLRNRPLPAGSTEMLHIYDSDVYAAVPVEVLRRETVTLPLFRKVETMVVQPRLKTDGIFRRTGDVLIWLSDDGNRVPVKVVTSIALGRVTAELVSAETGMEKQ